MKLALKGLWPSSARSGSEVRKTVYRKICSKNLNLHQWAAFGRIQSYPDVLCSLKFKVIPLCYSRQNSSTSQCAMYYNVIFYYLKQSHLLAFNASHRCKYETVNTVFTGDQSWGHKEPIDTPIMVYIGVVLPEIASFKTIIIYQISK